MIYLLNQKIFASVSFSFDTAGVQGGTVLPFKGPLHAGIESKDTRDEVELRMGIKPYFVSDPELKKNIPRSVGCCGEPSHVERYELPPYHFSYHFKTLDSRLSMLGIDLCKVRVYGAKNRPPERKKKT